MARTRASIKLPCPILNQWGIGELPTGDEMIIKVMVYKLWASFLLISKITILILVEHAVKVLLEWLFFTVVFQLRIHYLGGTKPAVCYRGWIQVKEYIWKPKYFHVKDNGPLCKCSLNGLDKPRETLHCQVRTDFSACCQHGMHLKQPHVALLNVSLEPPVLTCQEAALWYKMLPINSLKQVG